MISAGVIIIGVSTVSAIALALYVERRRKQDLAKLAEKIEERKEPDLPKQASYEERFKASAGRSNDRIPPKPRPVDAAPAVDRRVGNRRAEEYRRLHQRQDTNDSDSSLLTGVGIGYLAGIDVGSDTPVRDSTSAPAYSGGGGSFGGAGASSSWGGDSGSPSDSGSSSSDSGSSPSSD